MLELSSRSDSENRRLQDEMLGDPGTLETAQNSVIIVTPLFLNSLIDVRASIDSSRPIVRPISFSGDNLPALIISNIST